MNKIKLLISLMIAITITQTSVCQNVDDIEIKLDSLSKHVYVLFGAGGNIGVCQGNDGVLIIDTQFAELAERIKSEIARINDGPIKYVLNTNWHYDHVRGNKAFADDGAKIIAHRLTKEHMMKEVRIDTVNGEVPVYPPEALPVELIEHEMDLHFNGEDIEIIHVPNAHSDADLIFIFKNANVIHTGDLCFNGGYPFIDINNGGSIDGMIRAAGQIIDLMDKETIVIPGHGQIMNVADVEDYKKMLETIRKNIAKLVKKGKNLEEVIEAKPTAKFDAKNPLFVPADNFVRIVYNDLKSNG
jgi:glyoxylase-like metal-dependent hydrolase (beta-lactamase superfamily II)